MVAFRVGMVLAFALCSPVWLSANGMMKRIDVSPVRLGDGLRRQMISDERARRTRLDAAFPIWTIPTCVSAAGQFGAYFKMKLIVLNPTTRSYQVNVTFFDAGGKVETRTLQLGANSQRIWEDVLLEGFGRTGAGALEFDAWFDPPGGSVDNDFAIFAEVYTESPNGRYKTIVVNGHLPEDISGSFRTVNVAVNVNANERTNVGVFNDSSFSTRNVSARVFNISGTLVETVVFTLGPNAWSQKSVSAQVTHGTIEWQTDGLVYPYVVTVDNRSNDGSLATPYIYIP